MLKKAKPQRTKNATVLDHGKSDPGGIYIYGLQREILLRKSATYGPRPEQFFFSVRTHVDIGGETPKVVRTNRRL